MFNLFGKKEKKQQNTQEQSMKAIADLSKKIEEMEEKITHIETRKEPLPIKQKIN
jgi:hypothetical protein